jgi:hypothetical protein
MRRLALAALIILLLCPTAASAAACLPSPAAVRAAYPGAWPMWTHQAPGHRGEQCWYPRGARYRLVEDRSSKAPAELQAPSAIPLPRPHPLELEHELWHNLLFGERWPDEPRPFNERWP